MAKKSSGGKGEKKGAKGSSETNRRMAHRGSKHMSLASILKDARTVALDGDRTLIDYTDVAEKSYNGVLKSRGYQTVSKSYVRNAIGRKSPRMAFRMFGMTEAEAKDAAAEYEMLSVRYASDYKAERGAVRLVHGLKKNGKRLPVVSNSSDVYLRPGLQAVVDEYNMTHSTNETIGSLFGRTRGSYGDERDKPSPTGLKAVKADAYIGDSAEDSEAAYNADIPFIGLLQKDDSSTEFEHIPDRLAPDVLTLAHQVEALYKEAAPPMEAGQHATQLSDMKEIKQVSIGVPEGQYSSVLWNNYRHAA